MPHSWRAWYCRGGDTSGQWALKKITIQNRYLIPQIDDLLDQLKGAKYFSNIDFKSDYHEVPIEPSDVCKTTFKSKEVLFEWLVMPFGLTNAPKSFMRLMEDILRPFTNAFMVVYLCDILIFNRVRQVLQTPQQHKLCAHLEKCTFGMTQVQYLSTSLMRRVCMWTQPRYKWFGIGKPQHSNTAPQISRSCQFLPQVCVGVLSYHFTFKSSHQGRNESKVCFFTQHKAFSKLMHCLYFTPVITLPNLQQPFEIKIDASDYASDVVIT